MAAWNVIKHVINIITMNNVIQDYAKTVMSTVKEYL